MQSAYHMLQECFIICICNKPRCWNGDRRQRVIKVFYKGRGFLCVPESENCKTTKNPQENVTWREIKRTSNSDSLEHKWGTCSSPHLPGLQLASALTISHAVWSELDNVAAMPHWFSLHLHKSVYTGTTLT